MEIQRVDLRSGAIADEWHRVYDRADRFERPHASPWSRHEVVEEFEASLRTDSRVYAGFVDGSMVCVGTLQLPLLDNLGLANVEVYTDPTHRRRGYATQLARHLEATAQDEGRRRARSEVSVSLEGFAPGIDFAGGLGYALALRDVMRSLALPVPDQQLAALAEEAAAHHAGYRLESFVGSVPDEWASEVVRLDANLMVDAPSGTLEIEATTTDLPAFREHEETLRRQGRTVLHPVALYDSTVVGYTTVTVSKSEPDRGFQWGTMVDGPHRGHRLGMALKVANLRQVQAHNPEMSSIVTWNAEENAPMIAVNDQLGFVPVERFAEFEKAL